MKPNKKFMMAAIKEGIKAGKFGEHPIGSVIVKNNKIIVSAGPEVRRENDPTMHAEVVAIRKATKRFKNRYLTECVLYSTHEPCSMCTAAAVWAKMKAVVFGATLADMDQWGWRLIYLKTKDILKHSQTKIPVIGGFMRKECKKLKD